MEVRVMPVGKKLGKSAVSVFLAVSLAISKDADLPLNLSNPDDRSSRYFD
jgi:hypothetical protein